MAGAFLRCVLLVCRWLLLAAARMPARRTSSRSCAAASTRCSGSSPSPKKPSPKPPTPCANPSAPSAMPTGACSSLPAQQRDAARARLARFGARQTRTRGKRRGPAGAARQAALPAVPAGQPEPLRLVLNRQDPNEIARQMHYLELYLRARAPSSSPPCAQIWRTWSACPPRSQAKSRRAGQPAERTRRGQRKQLEQRAPQPRRDARDRSRTRSTGSASEISHLKRNEERLARLVERLARELARPPTTRAVDLRNDQLAGAGARSGGSVSRAQGTAEACR